MIHDSTVMNRVVIDTSLFLKVLEAINDMIDLRIDFCLNGLLAPIKWN